MSGTVDDSGIDCAGFAGEARVQFRSRRDGPSLTSKDVIFILQVLIEASLAEKHPYVLTA